MNDTQALRELLRSLLLVATVPPLANDRVAHGERQAAPGAVVQVSHRSLRLPRRGEEIARHADAVTQLPTLPPSPTRGPCQLVLP
jgi:hypothetical protein